MGMTAFEDALRSAAGNRELLEQYDRLTKSNLSRRGSPIELAVDDATGRTEKEFAEFARFVFEYVWLPVALEEGILAEEDG